MKHYSKSSILAKDLGIELVTLIRTYRAELGPENARDTEQRIFELFNAYGNIVSAGFTSCEVKNLYHDTDDIVLMFNCMDRLYEKYGFAEIKEASGLAAVVDLLLKKGVSLEQILQDM